MTTIGPAKKSMQHTAALDIGARALALAAAPVFALMAGVEAAGPQTVLCSALPGPLPVGGMVWMYVLMSVFHLPAWLRLASATAAVPQGHRNDTSLNGETDAL